MNKKIIIFALTFVCLIMLPFSAQAEEYGTDFPTYINYSGGAYIEVQSTLGRGSLILQDTYKSGYLGFYGSGYSLCNISNSTITGKYVTNTGTLYNARFSAFGQAQYYYESGVTREWRDLAVTKIYNTNIGFIDETSLKRDNKIDIFDGDVFKYTVVACLFLLIFLRSFTLIRIGKVDY